MWVSTKKKLNNSIMFFQFIKKKDFFIFYFTDMKQLYSKEIHESSFSSIYSVDQLNVQDISTSKLLSYIFSERQKQKIVASNSLNLVSDIVDFSHVLNLLDVGNNNIGIKIATNQMIEVDVVELVEFLKNNEEIKNIDYNFYTQKMNIRTDMTITLTEGFSPFKLEFELKINDADSFYSHITLPLLYLIQNLKKSQDALFNIIKKKDSEIDEYVLEGGNITNKNIKTETFEKDNFIMNILQQPTNLCNENINLYEIYSSPLVEQFNMSFPDEHDGLNSKFMNKEEDKEDKIVSIKKKSIDCTTTMEITQTSISVKKKKSSVLKNL